MIKALNTGIVFFPLVNPDGVRYDQATDSLWRKNRNPANGDGTPRSIGVDINRNYDFLWDFRSQFDPSVVNSSSLASDNPRLETYHGPAPFSEPETRNVKWILDQFPRLRWYMDIHSAAGDILYNWGDDDNQSVDPSMSFLDPRWDGRRGVVTIDDYREWISDRDGAAARGVARRVAGAMRAVGGRSFNPLQAVGLYPTSGASDDYVVQPVPGRPEHEQDLWLHDGVRLPDQLLPDHPGVPPERGRRRRRTDGVLSRRHRRRVGLEIIAANLARCGCSSKNRG